MMPWVLLRGLARESGHWGPFVGCMHRAWPGSPIVTLDLPGTGCRHRERSPTTVRAIAQECRARLRQQGIETPYALLGLSLGGMVAAQWAAAWPGEVDRCVLVNTSLRPHGGFTQRLRPSAWLPLAEALLGRDPMAVERIILRMTSSRPREHARIVEQWTAISRQRPVTARNALAQLWSAARCRAPNPPPAVPTLVLCSAGDRLVDPDCSRSLAAAWSCPVDVHPDAGHDLPLDDPSWIVSRIQRTWPAPADRETGMHRG